MNIDFIYDCVYPFSKGGAEKRIFEYARLLSYELHNRARIVSMNWWHDTDDIIDDNIEYIAVCRKRKILGKNSERKVTTSLFFGVAIFFYVLRRKDVDILDIEVFPYFPLIFAKCAIFFKRKKPIIIGYWSECLGEEYWKKNYRIFWQLGVLLEKLSFKSCDQIIANSCFTKNRIKQTFKKKDDIMVLSPVSIDITQINNISAQCKKYDIIYYGRIIAHKHVGDIINVVYDLVKSGHNVKALIIGTGPDLKNIERSIYERGLMQNIEHINFVEEYDDLIAKIKLAKVMIQPSEREGFGITVIEANACGLPVFVVSHPHNAAKNLIKDGVNGFVCKDFEDLSDKVQSFFMDIEQLEDLSQGSIHAAESYSRRIMDKRVNMFYNQLLK